MLAEGNFEPLDLLVNEGLRLEYVTKGVDLRPPRGGIRGERRDKNILYWRKKIDEIESRKRGEEREALRE